MSPVRGLLYIGLFVAAALFLATAGCASFAQVRPCDHGRGVHLTARVLENQALPTIQGPSTIYFPPGVGPSFSPPVQILVVVHNATDQELWPRLSCGEPGNERLVWIDVPAHHERDLVFSVARRGNAWPWSVKFSCELRGVSVIGPGPVRIAPPSP